MIASGPEILNAEGGLKNSVPSLLFIKKEVFPKISHPIITPISSPNDLETGFKSNVANDRVTFICPTASKCTGAVSLDLNNILFVCMFDDFCK